MRGRRRGGRRGSQGSRRRVRVQAGSAARGGKWAVLDGLHARLGWRTDALESKFARHNSMRVSCELPPVERAAAVAMNRWDLALYKEAQRLYAMDQAAMEGEAAQSAIAAALHDAEVNTEGCGILRQGLIPDKLLAENPPTTLTPPTPLAPPATAVLAISATAVHPSLAEATFREVAGHTLHLPSVCFGRTLEEAS